MLLQVINLTVAPRPQQFKVYLTVERRDELNGLFRYYTFDFKWIFVEEKKMPFGYFKEFKVLRKINCIDK